MPPECSICLLRHHPRETCKRDPIEVKAEKTRRLIAEKQATEAANERLCAENQRLSEHNYRLYDAIRQHRESQRSIPVLAHDERLWSVLADAE